MPRTIALFIILCLACVLLTGCKFNTVSQDIGLGVLVATFPILLVAYGVHALLCVSRHKAIRLSRAKRVFHGLVSLGALYVSLSSLLDARVDQELAGMMAVIVPISTVFWVGMVWLACFPFRRLARHIDVVLVVMCMMVYLWPALALAQQQWVDMPEAARDEIYTTYLIAWAGVDLAAMLPVVLVCLCCVRESRARAKARGCDAPVDVFV